MPRASCFPSHRQASASQEARNFISLLLVRCVTPAPASTTASVGSSRREAAAAKPSSAAPETATTTAAAHAGNVGALRRHLDVATLEDAFVEDESLRDEAGLREFDIGISKTIPSD